MGFINFIKKRGQVGTEYLVILGFLVFVIIGLMAGAMIYSANLKDQMKLNQLEGFARKIVSSSEIVFYAGEPSRTTIRAYLPEGIEEITLHDREIYIRIHTNTGMNIISFPSNVNLTGEISKESGMKKIKIQARENDVYISE